MFAQLGFPCMAARESRLPRSEEDISSTSQARGVRGRYRVGLEDVGPARPGQNGARS